MQFTKLHTKKKEENINNKKNKYKTLKKNRVKMNEIAKKSEKKT